MVESKGNEGSIVVGKHLESLLQQSGITITGLAHGIEMSVNHLRTIRAGKASISSRTAGKIADFFEIEIGRLFSSKPIKLKSIKNISTINSFYEDNAGNLEFFINRKKQESSLMYFLRNTLLKSTFLTAERDVKDVKIHCEEEYQRAFSSKALSAQLIRLAEEGTLLSRDKFGNGSVYLYKLKTD